MTGSGNSMRSSTTGCAGSDSVSPVVVLFSPAKATMSPARASLMSSRWLACIASMRPTRSRLFLTVFSTWLPPATHARIDPHEGQRADKRIAHDLEGEPGKRLVVGRVAQHRLVGAHLDAVDRGDVGRRRQVGDDRIEQRLHALVLEGRAAQHRDKGARRSCPCGCSAAGSPRRAPHRRDRLRAPRRPARPRSRPACCGRPSPRPSSRPGFRRCRTGRRASPRAT